MQAFKKFPTICNPAIKTSLRQWRIGTKEVLKYEWY